MSVKKQLILAFICPLASSLLLTILSLITLKLQKIQITQNFILPNGWQYWLITAICTSLLFFLVKQLISLIEEKFRCEEGKPTSCCEKEKSKNAERYKAIWSTSLNIVKALIWPISVTIFASFTPSFTSTTDTAITIGIFALAFLLVCFAHLEQFISMSGFLNNFYKVNKLSSGTEDKIQTHYKNSKTVNGDSYSGETIKQIQNEIESEYVKNIKRKKLELLGYYVAATVAVAIPLTATRFLVPFFFNTVGASWSKQLYISLFGKRLDIFMNSSGFLAVCILDCILLISAFILIKRLGSYFFIKANEKYLNNNQSQISKTLTLQELEISKSELEAITNELNTFHKQKTLLQEIFNKQQIKFESGLFGSLEAEIANSEDVVDGDANSQKESKSDNITKNKNSSYKADYQNAFEQIINDKSQRKSVIRDADLLRKAIKYYEKTITQGQVGNLETVQVLKSVLDNIEYNIRKAFGIPKFTDHLKKFLPAVSLSIASTVIIHSINQIQKSIDTYGHIHDMKNMISIFVILSGLFFIGIATHILIAGDGPAKGGACPCSMLECFAKTIKDIIDEFKINKIFEFFAISKIENKFAIQTI
jgi:hypothetical protein